MRRRPRVQACLLVATALSSCAAPPTTTATTSADSGHARDAAHPQDAHATLDARARRPDASATDGRADAHADAVSDARDASTHVTDARAEVSVDAADARAISADSGRDAPDAARDAARDATRDATLATDAGDAVADDAGVTVPVWGVFTSRNDTSRTGQNIVETALTPANVNTSQFGKVLSLPVDGYVYAQPLFASGVRLADGTRHDVVYAATENDSVYAFDPDAKGKLLWKKSFLAPGVTAIPAADTVDPFDLQPLIGITGTPVIDPTSATLYVVAATKEPPSQMTGPSYVQRLHAIDITTGDERAGSPTLITASAATSSATTVTFDPFAHLQRPALLLANGIVYVALGSHGDVDPYHGWIVGYDAHTLAKVASFCTTPDAMEGSFWQSGDGLAADDQGNVYGETANGTFDGVTDFGDSALKLSPALALLDWFSPYNQAELTLNDLDFGSAGPLLLPDQTGVHPHLAIASGKPGLLYVLDRDGLGHARPTDDGQIVQTVPVDPNTSVMGQELGIFTTPAYWNGNVYVAPVNGSLTQYTVSGGLLSAVPVNQSPRTFSFPPPHVSISANGATDGVAWIIQGDGSYPVNPAVLRAYKASDVTVELYGSDLAPAGRDTAGAAVKFTTPTIANGRVYVPTQTEISVYGLLP